MYLVRDQLYVDWGVCEHTSTNEVGEGSLGMSSHDSGDGFDACPSCHGSGDGFDACPLCHNGSVCTPMNSHAPEPCVWSLTVLSRR
jgi:hypothetical protein